MSREEFFSSATFEFLENLTDNNQRDWFAEHKQRYETDVRQPALRFVEAIQPRLRKISPHIEAVAKLTGGSLMRIYRDTRFSKNKTPYKTNVGIHFRHEQGRDVHAPGLYVHLAPEECFLGAGIWHPESSALREIRTAIVEQPTQWKRARNDKRFREIYELAGDSLKKAPLGFDKDHPLIEDLKRKDFIGVHSFARKQAISPDFLGQVSDAFAASRPLVRFLCRALHVPF